MSNLDRFAQLKERLANTRLASRSVEIETILRGKAPLHAGVNVEVERASSKAPNGRDFHVRIAASTETIARDGGIVPMRAWERGGLKNFSANPIILAFHDHKSPIGISVYTEISEKNLIEYWLFHEETELSKTMRKLYENGFMRAASVGFLVHEFKFVDELSEDELESLYKQYGKAALSDVYWIAEKAELLETSAVPVPADPNALAFSHAARTAAAHGMDVTDLMKQFRGESMSTTAKPAEQTPVATATTEKAANEVVTQAQVTELRAAFDGEVVKFRAELQALTTRLEAAEKQLKEKSEVVDETKRGTELEIEIVKLDGETDAQARTRHIETVVREKLGMPIPATK